MMGEQQQLHRNNDSTTTTTTTATTTTTSTSTTTTTTTSNNTTNTYNTSYKGDASRVETATGGGDERTCQMMRGLEIAKEHTRTHTHTETLITPAL